MEQVSDRMKALVEALDFSLSRAELGDAAKDKLRDLREMVTTQLDSIVLLEDFVTLPCEAQTEADKIDFQSLNWEETLQVSRLLSALRRAAVRVHDVFWFDRPQLNLAKDIAAHYRAYSPSLKAFRSAKTQKDGHLSIQIDKQEKHREFLQLCQRSGAIKVAFVGMQKERKGPTKPYPKWEEWNFADIHRYYVKVMVLDKRLVETIRGDWMTAFVANVIEDHVELNNVSAEVFTKVRYEAPVDIIKSRSDFDVITLIGETALCLECKTGYLTSENAQDIIQKARDIADVLGKFATDVDRFRFFLVYDDEVNTGEQIETLFVDSPVSPKRIDEVRLLVAEEFAV